MNIYEKCNAWLDKRPATDLWKAGVGIILIVMVLFLLTACGTSGPRMTLASSENGDGFIEIRQPLYQSPVTCTPPKHEWFLDYIHHSEIFHETNEDVFDGVRVGYSHNFGKWKWQK